MKLKQQTTDDILSIVVGDLYRRGAPIEESPVVRRTFDGPDQVVVELTPLQDRVSYVYRRIRSHGEVEELEYRVRVSWQPANLGGVRALFRCSNPGCGRRARRLFLTDPYLVCRRCANVRYPSQFALQPQHIKSVARAKTIRTRLGGRPILGDPVPLRPQGMHHRTYERLVADLAEIERAEEDRAIRDGELSFIDVFVRRLRESISTQETAPETTES